ncbi:sushi, von Willebrand factor type A, EGF and pentraxin domain-containing protein 1-like [Dreissena polymorpha]|uniref:sushi, von Willebrand factor type A, EGF and pentraxin domain-containing protein 1-like n=1 Tax=Dreissena polymorpha TaxID=45954 RepID=UPI0022652520|nr:sushi, von Willebrand factor type A, EGF and pentraxin domain-containing protein 1-like [Dreissena polymorpha]
MANISCDSGYAIQGSATSKCNASGKWSDTCQMCISSSATEIVHRTCFGDCTFDLGDLCQYKSDTSWTIKKGSFEFMNRSVIRGGLDDDFYAISNPSTSALFSMTSPLLPGGAACLSFYYTLPVATTTFYVKIRTEDNSTSEVWNVTNHGIRTWTKVEGLVIWQIKKYFVEYVAQPGLNAFIGIDNIHLENLYCDIGYSLNISEVDDYCNTSRTEFPSCQLVDCGQITAPKNGNISAHSTTYGSTATFQCLAGYILNGSSTSKCGSDDCGRFPAPNNGNVSANSTTYGSVATVRCQAGYILNGSITSKCRSDGKWNLTGQSCKPVGNYLNFYLSLVTA